MIFRDRRDAGRFLATKLSRYANEPDVLVLALPRGGVPVAFEVAKALRAPLDVFLVRKLGVPGHEESAMGAIASGDIMVLNESAIEALGIPDSIVDAVIERERQELVRREAVYRGDRPELEITDRVIVLVDDGLATGSTMLAAAQALRRHAPKRLVVAVPVGAPDTCDAFRDEVDDVICGAAPERFYAVGQWYEDFSQTTDDEVQQLLTAASHWPPTHASG
jgi:predicted phosphoribosyltransferase